jgi:signal transduction histidine kinase
VFLNLIVNAAHAMQNAVAGTAKRGLLSIKTRVDGDPVVIEVGDTGCGIPERIRDRVFDPFFTTKPVGQGTGQGSRCARAAVVDRHGGGLTFESSSAGTTFFVRLPIHGFQAIRLANAS